MTLLKLLDKLYIKHEMHKQNNQSIKSNTPQHNPL